MNYLARFGDRHDRKDKKDKKMPDRSQSVEPTTTPLSPDSNPRRRLDTPRTDPGAPPTNVDLALVEEADNEAAPHQHGKRRTVSISRSGRYKSRSKGRSRILSDEVYSGMSVAAASPTTSPSSPPQPSPQQQKDLVKPNGRDKSPARPYIILKSDTSVNFAIESTSL